LCIGIAGKGHELRNRINFESDRKVVKKLSAKILDRCAVNLAMNIRKGGGIAAPEKIQSLVTSPFKNRAKRVAVGGNTDLLSAGGCREKTDHPKKP
jgi:hypothetical protein